MRALMMVAALSALFVSFAQPALAACGSELQWAERRLPEIRDPGYRHMARDQLQSARDAAARSDDARCREHIRTFDLLTRFDDVQDGR